MKRFDFDEFDRQIAEVIEDPKEELYWTYCTGLGHLMMERAAYIEINGEAGIDQAPGIDAETAYAQLALLVENHGTI